MEEKKLYIIVHGSGRSCKPSWSQWSFAADEPITRAEAQDILWDGQRQDCTVDSWEECTSCEGKGCNVCDHEGGWESDWSSVVESNTYGYLEEYDPEEHKEVPSDRPEHHIYKATSRLESAEWKKKQAVARVGELTKQLAEARADLHIAHTMTVLAKFTLENRLDEYKS